MYVEEAIQKEKFMYLFACEVWTISDNSSCTEQASTRHTDADVQRQRVQVLQVLLGNLLHQYMSRKLQEEYKYSRTLL
jgi:hypothetical protein